MDATKASNTALKAVFATLLLALGALHQCWKQYPDDVSRALQFLRLDEALPRLLNTKDNGVDFALFTHEKNELHCMERELRHPCVKELRDYLDETGNKQVRSVALNCVNEVLAWSTDYFELKNMTHLLLDLDTVAHVFDKESRSNDFVMAGIKFAEKLVDHEECVNEFDTKNTMQTRCVPLYAKIVILKYKNAGMMEDAKRVFDKVTSMSFKGKVNTYAAGEAVRWDHWQHTPQIWLDGLRSQPVWPQEQHKDLPIVKALEDHFDNLREEAMKAVKDPADSGFEDAYRFLYEKGNWDHVMLYHNRTFSEECETVFPKTCAMLKKQLPSKPGLPWTSNQNEQAMVIKMAEGTDVELHSGPANNILNIHIGIAGLEGAKLTIANETYKWNEGKVIAWDGSFDHAVDCINCKTERVIMMVRYMHPDTSAAHFKGIKRTHYEEVPLEMQ
jgi:hypothetical protein